jgi:hypothetical protein
MTKTKRKAKNYSLSPAAFYTALCGLNLLALAMCDTALRVESAIAQNPNLIGSAYIPAMETVFGSLVLLCGGVLLIDYQGRR